MTSEASFAKEISAAWTLLQQGAAVEAQALLTVIPPDHPLYAEALHARGVAAARAGNLQAARALLLDAIERGKRDAPVWLHLAAVAGDLGCPADLLSIFSRLLPKVHPDALPGFLKNLLHSLRFLTPDIDPRKDAVFEQILMPFLIALLDRGDVNLAMAIENWVYSFYVKTDEREDHFEKIMRRMSAEFTRAAKRIAPTLPPLPRPDLRLKPYRIGFFIHSESMLAHIENLLSMLKGYRNSGETTFEPVIYAFSGAHAGMEQAAAALNVPVVNLGQRFPETANNNWLRLQRLRELLAEDGVHELVWISLVTMMPLAFGLRIAPVQTWFAMKYRNFSLPDIDGYVTGSALTRYRSYYGRRWRMGRLGMDDWLDTDLAPQARALRESFGGRLILITLGRTEKMQNPAYLGAMASILKAHPDTLFLWAGRDESPAVVKAFRDAGVLAQTRFIGWVNTRLYAQVADIFLDTFPFPCTSTLYQAMAAGTPTVIYDSPEALQTGLWGFIQPVLDGEDATPEERAELAALVGDAARPLIPVARTAEDYVAHASRLIVDAEARASAGEACRDLIARYFSDSRIMGRSFAEHFVELIEGAQDKSASQGDRAG